VKFVKKLCKRDGNLNGLNDESMSNGVPRVYAINSLPGCTWERAAGSSASMV
jgi:hypothetical protein